MYSYALLEPGCYYLIQEQEESPISLIQVGVVTDHCLYVSKFGDEETTAWKKKSDTIFDILELVSDDAVKEWEAIYNKDAYNYEEGEE